MFFIGKTKRDDTGRVIGRSRRFRIISTGAFCLLAILTLLAVFPIVKHKDEAEATTVPATTTLSIISAKDTASVDITPTSGTGTFATSAAADQAEFSVTTDNLTGYSVTLLGSDTSGQLVNAVTGDTLDTITADTTENDFRTGSASTYANKWGYRLNVNGTTTTNFMVAPTTSTAKTIYSTNAPNVTTDNYTLALGARIDYEKPAGTYTNTFILTAVGNPISYQIDYIDNYDGTSTLLEQDANSNITASEFTISAANPTRSGATFKGWCYGTVDHTTNPSTCGGTPGDVYQSGDTFTFTSLPSSGTATAELYAMWEMGDTMQAFTPEQCRTRAASGDYTLTDTRDGMQYTVRYINGECWMTQNLVFQGTTLNPNDSDVTTTRTMDYKDLISDTTHCNGNNSGTGASYTNDCIYYKASDSYNGNRPNAWYNFKAVTAGTISGSSNADEPTESICPKGWRLPTNSQYNALLSYTGSAATVFNPILGGYINTNTLLTPASYSAWWSSTPNGGYLRYIPWDNSGTVATINYGYRAAGYYARCVMRQTMQNFSSQDAGAMATGDIKTLEDERDGQTYTVAKLSDGNVYMTRNLAIGCNGTGATYGGTAVSKTITSGDSNISAASWATPTDTVAGQSGYWNDAKMTCSSTYGAYYNYPAATAGTIIGNSNTDEATESICPKGWRLPTYDEYVGIYNVTQFNPSAGGAYANGGQLLWTAFGYFWSATAQSATNRYYAVKDTGKSVIDHQNNNSRSDYGAPVRCIKSDDDLPTMQSVSDADLASLVPNTGDSATLKDARDGQNYTVARLGDGNVWMTRNLAIGCDGTGSTYGSNRTGSTISNTDSNISASSWTMPTTGITDDFTTPMMACDATYGGFYNYAAVSAEAITGSSNIDKGENNICPAGWTLPTEAQSVKIIDFTSMFNAVTGGLYRGGTKGWTDRGYWWTSDAADGNFRYTLNYVNSTLGTMHDYRIHRSDGAAIRCVKVDSTPVMQDLTNAQLDALVPNTGDVATVKDSRDGLKYKVSRLADGNVWMLDNLSLDLSNASLRTQLTSSTTNATDTILGYLKNGGGSGAYPAYGVSVRGSSSDIWADAYDRPYIATGSRNVHVTKYGAGSDDVGIYYNFCAASAGSYCYASGAGTGNAQYDICPKGWRMPTSGTSGEYQALYTAYSSNATNFKAALGALLSGRFYSGSVHYQNSFGYFSSSTMRSDSSVYGLLVDGSTASPSNDDYRYNGWSVRCVKDDPDD